jgi:hypothetical protein
MPNSSAELREYAEQCLRAASSMWSETEREFLVEMAARWHTLAEEREQEEEEQRANDSRTPGSPR